MCHIGIFSHAMENIFSLNIKLLFNEYGYHSVKNTVLFLFLNTLICKTIFFCESSCSINNLSVVMRMLKKNIKIVFSDTENTDTF